MTKAQLKILISSLIGFIIIGIAMFIIFFANIDNDPIFPTFLPIAFFFTYEYLIINFVKGDYLTKEHEKMEKQTYDSYTRFSSYWYRRLIKFFLAVCIIMMPLMWGLTIVECAGMH